MQLRNEKSESNSKEGGTGRERGEVWVSMRLMEGTEETKGEGEERIEGCEDGRKTVDGRGV